MFYTIINSLALICLCIGILFNVKSHYSTGEDAMNSAVGALLGYGSAVVCLALEGLVYVVAKLF